MEKEWKEGAPTYPAVRHARLYFLMGQLKMGRISNRNPWGSGKKFRDICTDGTITKGARLEVVSPLSHLEGQERAIYVYPFPAQAFLLFKQSIRLITSPETI
jgi:hypothetical protein